jgi:transcriptional regulator with XRE-family HTH domain
MNDTKIIVTVAENVRRARTLAGLSQEELAVEAEVDRTYVSQVERGKRNITIVVLARLAGAMHTTAAALVSAQGTEKRRSGSRARRAQIEAIVAFSACSGLLLAVLEIEMTYWNFWRMIAGNSI